MSCETYECRKCNRLVDITHECNSSELNNYSEIIENLNARVKELKRLIKIAYPIMAIEKYEKYMDNDYSLIDWQNDANKILKQGE